MTITREIKEKSRYFEGNPREGWELLTIVQGKKYNTYYYQDTQGNYHHTSVKRKDAYNPFETKIRDRDGITFVKITNKKTGQPIRRRLLLFYNITFLYLKINCIFRIQQN